jgi:hypothetical protein
MARVKLAIWFLFRKFGFGPVLLRIHPKSALLRCGWFRSFRKKEPVDREGNPIPWWTYAAVDFLQDRIDSSWRVLEFGCGNSTIWLSSRAKEVISIENHASWADRIRPRLGKNAKVLLVESLEEFARGRHEDLGRFDVLIIDAGNRLECARQAVGCLHEQGVVIWDNTNGPDWPRIRQFMRDLSFEEISFAGLSAQEICLTRTTIFYREHNVLGI